MIRAEDVRQRLLAEEEVLLARFTSEELVVVGAHSPLEGLNLSERLNEMGPIPLTAALSAALRGLVARGFAHPPGSAEPGDPVPEASQPVEVMDLEGEDTVPVPLTGDLALVVALRREPALVGLVRTPRAADLAGLGLALPGRTELVLHGFTAESGELAGVLEERRSPLGIHRFVLRTLRREAEALATWVAGWTGREGSPLDAGVEEWEADLELCLPGAGGEGTARAQVLLDLPVGPRAGEPATLHVPDQPPLALSLEELPARLAATVLQVWRELSPEAPPAAGPLA